jgi:hypothetical protein
VADFVAEGAISNGAPVILTANGTVSSTFTSKSTLANATLYGISNRGSGSGGVRKLSVAFDKVVANKFVYVESKAGTKVTVGTVTPSNNDVCNFGTALTVESYSGRDGHAAIAAHPQIAGRYAIVYHDTAGSTSLRARVLQVASSGTGTTIATLGNELTIANNAASQAHNTDYFTISWDLGAGSRKFIVAYVAKDGTSHQGQPHAVVCDFSSTNNLSVGTILPFGATGARSVTSQVDPFDTNTILVTYTIGHYLTGVVLTRNNNTLTSGIPTVLASNTSMYPKCHFDPTTQGRFAVICFSSGVKVVVGNKSGSTLTVGTPTIIATTSWAHESLNMCFDPNLSGRFGAVHDDNATNQFLVLGDIHNMAVVNTTSVQSATLPACRYAAIDFDPNRVGIFVTAAGQNTGSDYYQARAGLSGTQGVILTSDNFVGLSTADYADSSTASITLQGGLSSNQTGLSLGATYYVQTDSTLDTTAGSPNVIAGKALSATSILLKSY